jgi:ParB-like chromosome segregation protein Spo0J
MIDLRRIPIEQLQPAPYNPRVPLEPGSPGYRRLERSIDEFDLVQPIVWNEETGHVVSGHQRLEILRQRGVHEIAVAVVSLSLDREKALNITLNNRLVGSDWDTTKLVNLLGDLQELPNFDATLTGFDEQDLRDLLFTPDPDRKPDVADPDEEDVVPVTLDILLDRWESLRAKLDAFVAEERLALHVQLPDQRAKTSPPACQ